MTKYDRDKKYKEKYSEKIKDKSKEYYQKNKDKILEKQKEYRQKHTEEINDKLYRPIECACGKTVQYRHLSEHNRSMYHIKNNVLKIDLSI